MRCLFRRLYIFTFVNLLLVQDTALAEIISPVTISNYSPLVFIHGLPYIGDAEVLGKNTSRTRLMYDVTSHYAEDKNDNENILLDGETYRATFIYEQGISNNFQLGLIIPYIKHRPGDLDSFINEWHDVFGMPEGGRDLVDTNLFQYTYTRDAQTRFDIVDASSGIGDVRVESSWQLKSVPGEVSAFALSVKFPTGKSDNFHGSGAADVALWYKEEFVQGYFDFRGSGFYSLGGMYLNEGDVLPDMVRSFVGFAGIGGGVHVTDSLIFVSQLDINTPFYSSSDLVELGSYAVQLTLGGSILFADYGRINLGVGEDLVIDASPDVTFHLDMDFRF